MKGLFKPRKSPFWWISYTLDGKLKRESTKMKDKNKALTILVKKREYAEKVKQGEAMVIDDVKLSELFRRVIRHSAGRITPGTIKSKENSFNRFVAFAGDIQAKRVNNATIEQFQNSRLIEGLMPQTINIQVIHIKSAMKRGHLWGMLPDLALKNMAMVNPLKVNAEPRSAMSIEELNHLLSFSSQWKPLLSLIAFTGCRLMEAYNLTWSDVNLKLNTLTFRKTKNGDYRQIPLLPQARAVIEGLKVVSLDPDAWVFMPRVEGIADALKHVFKRAKLSQYSTHSLRHTFVSLSIMAGASESTVQRIVGHKSNRMTRHYTHLSPAFLQTEMDRLKGAFESKSAEKVHTSLQTAAAANG